MEPFESFGAVKQVLKKACFFCVRRFMNQVERRKNGGAIRRECGEFGAGNIPALFHA
ncbi:hypothetical protein FUAX_36310 [Fulvitalea axinellae]|uniref:Uncharacterized protein n=1 Tax=Fulvitalea axinellae TaxID=1182444 RepID=A0AAU9CXH3_9BACT|nr:hypothetical protein FUAX_36310 [Fulvitalea axinellae]